MNPLSYVDIDAWMRVTRNGLEQWEVEAIMKIDKAWLKASKDDESNEETTDGSG